MHALHAYTHNRGLELYAALPCGALAAHVAAAEVGLRVSRTVGLAHGRLANTHNAHPHPRQPTHIAKKKTQRADARDKKKVKKKSSGRCNT
jgi:hypothetical protein